ncbi:2Fe-2S iron-sulfur cluster-binding protein [Aquimarina sediminis]|uniref:2Fe-2S iron-sulfur cluster-binding protein n=1 Tax=Aquimarina sediminis TaxID=2070536 RepID=UPI000CA00018|nr:2Fe-2S iron-sulfur cluster-binding protein [Aquimarina sediminis]
MYSIFVIDSIGVQHVLEFKKFEYPTLIELLVERLFDDIGDCKGRGLCGTCHIRIKSSTILSHHPTELELETLKSQLDNYPDSRLACQVLLNEDLDKMQIEIIGGD